MKRSADLALRLPENTLPYFPIIGCSWTFHPPKNLPPHLITSIRPAPPQLPQELGAQDHQLDPSSAHMQSHQPPYPPMQNRPPTPPRRHFGDTHPSAQPQPGHRTSCSLTGNGHQTQSGGILCQSQLSSVDTSFFQTNPLIDLTAL